MLRTRHQVSNCTIGATLQVLGDEWTLLIIRESFAGVTRFDQFAEILGCPRTLLTQRLRKLVDEGVLVRSQYREPGRRARNEYHLTEAGKELMPLLVALMHWGDRHRGGPEGAPIVARHAECGAPLALSLVCAEGHVISRAEDGEVVPGPGALPPVPA